MSNSLKLIKELATTDSIIKNLATDPITSPLLQIILTGFAAFCAEKYPAESGEEIRLKGGSEWSHATKAIDYLAFIGKQKNAGNSSNEIKPELVGKLNTRFGLKGYIMAEVGTEVYELKDRYIIYLTSELDNSLTAIPFYKDTLAPNIDFYIA